MNQTETLDLDPKTVLIFVTSLTQWHTMRLIAEALLDTNLADPKVIIIDNEESLDLSAISVNIPVNHIQDLYEHHTHCSGTASVHTKVRERPKKSTRLGRGTITTSSILYKLIKAGTNTLPGYKLLRKFRASMRENSIIKKEVARLGYREEFFISFLSEYQPICVVVPGDRGLGDQPPLLAACRKLGIPTVIPPTALSCPVEILARTRMDRRYYASRSFSREYPNQVWQDQKTGREISFFPERDTRVLAGAGMLPAHPKILGGGHTALLLVDSDASREHAIENGVSGRKICVTGNSDTDRLYTAYTQKSERRREFFLKYKLDENAVVTIVNLPLFNDVGWPHHAEREVHEVILSEVLRVSPSAFLSAHPRMIEDDKRYLSEQFGIQLLEERLSDALAISDLYISDQPSTTIFWAILAEVPTISLNWSWYTSPTIVNDIEGVVLATSAVEFRSALELLLDKKTQTNIRKIFERTKHRYGPFDGNSMARIINSIVNCELKN